MKRIINYNYPPIVGFGYRARSGKSTAAQQLEMLTETRYDNLCVFRYSFANPIKHIVHNVLKFPERHDFKNEVIQSGLGLTGRQAYQRVGDFLRHTFGDGIFTHIMQHNVSYVGTVAASDQRFPLTIIDDVRFKVEEQWIRERKGVLINVYRPSLGEIADEHSSEREGAELRWDYTLVNDTTQANLLARVDDLLDDLFGGATE